MEPSYREGYPKLDLREVQAAFFNHRRVCWFKGPNFLRGEVLVLETPGDVLTIHYLFTGRGYERAEDTQSLPLDPAPTRLNPERHYFGCPSCDEAKMTLFFKRRWACGECHELRYRSQALSGPGRAYERNFRRRDVLRALLVNGRPHRMRNTTFQRLHNELQELEDWLQVHPAKVASNRQQLIVTHEWHRASELNEPLWSPGYIREGDLIVSAPWLDEH